MMCEEGQKQSRTYYCLKYTMQKIRDKKFQITVNSFR